MDTKDIIFDQDLLAEAAKIQKDHSLSNTYKWYLHLQYIKYIEGVAIFLAMAAETNNGRNVVSLSKDELRVLANTLFKTKTYGDKQFYNPNCDIQKYNIQEDINNE